MAGDAARGWVAPPAAIVAAAACLLGAEGIHTAVIEAHLREWWAAGGFFLLVSVVEGALGVALLLCPSRTLATTALVTSVGTVLIWTWSRTTGLPFGPEAGYPEAIGRADLVATLLESGTALSVLPLACGRRSAGGLRRPGAGSGRVATVVVVGLVGVVTALGIGGADDHVHGHPVLPQPINVAAR